MGAEGIVPLGKAETVRQPATTSTIVGLRRDGARRRSPRPTQAGSWTAEVIDLLTLWPWDQEAVIDSVARTGRLVIVEEAPAGRLGRRHRRRRRRQAFFGALEAPPLRITLPDAPVPYSGALEARFLPSPAYVAEQVDALSRATACAAVRGGRRARMTSSWPSRRSAAARRWPIAVERLRAA